MVRAIVKTYGGEIKVETKGGERSELSLNYHGHPISLINPTNPMNHGSDYRESAWW
jgi:hypothetical protein